MRSNTVFQIDSPNTTPVPTLRYGTNGIGMAWSSNTAKPNTGLGEAGGTLSGATWSNSPVGAVVVGTVFSHPMRSVTAGSLAVDNLVAGAELTAVAAMEFGQSARVVMPNNVSQPVSGPQLGGPYIQPANSQGTSAWFGAFTSDALVGTGLGPSASGRLFDTTFSQPSYSLAKGTWFTQSATTFNVAIEPTPPIQAARISNSSTVISPVEDYDELASALDDMVSPEIDEDIRIKQSVYDASRNVAAWLMTHSILAPQVFSHGPNSVVFNWSDGVRNSYLTISAGGIFSALVSSPDRIKFRRDYSVNELSDLVSVIAQIGSEQQGMSIIPHTTSTDLILIAG
jgi:hypothetical protein